MRDGGRMHIGQAAARQPRLQGVEPVRRGVERIQAPGVAHGCPQRQRLAARAGTEVDHHLAPLGVSQQGQQLRALVLHLECTAVESVHPVQRGLAGQAQAPWRKRGGPGLDAGLGQLGLHVAALVGQGVNPHVERAGLVQGGHKRPEFRAQLVLERLHQPVGQVMPMPFHQIANPDLPALVEPLCLLLREGAAQEIVRSVKAQNGHAALAWATA